MTGRHRAKARAERFGEIRAAIEAEAEHAGCQRFEREAERRAAVVQQEELHEKRRAAKEFDVGAQHAAHPASAKELQQRDDESRSQVPITTPAIQVPSVVASPAAMAGRLCVMTVGSNCMAWRQSLRRVAGGLRRHARRATSAPQITK